MRQEVMLWSNEVYKNRFICRCGADLHDDHATMSGWFEGRQYLICKKCAKPVAVIRTIEVEEKLQPGLYGDFNEFMAKRLG